MKRLTLTILCVIFAACAANADGYLSDPMAIGVGARALGMGKAYVGMAEDGDAVFINPAGLGKITHPKLTSMYTSLLGDVSYSVLGGAYPYGENSAFGLGLVSSRVPDIQLTDASGYATGTASWGNSVLLLSYGTSFNKLSVGGSLKYFMVGGDGTAEVKSASGTGIDVDLGALYPVNDRLTVGAVLQNALPAAMGGKITKGTGSTDTVPSTLKLGARAILYGSPQSARKLYGNFDYDYSPSAKSGAAHYGVEFWPTNNLALRAGSDSGDLTGGVGVRAGGLAFDYAYHLYHNVPENSTHFFSISYLGEPPRREVHISVASPADKSVIYGDRVKVSGEVEVTGNEALGPAPLPAVKVNDTPVAVSSEGTFTAEASVGGPGKKILLVEAESGGASARQEVRLLKLASFSDVAENHWAKKAIENVSTLGLISGYEDGTFKPEANLTRAELAALLVRVRGSKAGDLSANKSFKDVSPASWAAKYVEEAKYLDMIKGYTVKKTVKVKNGRKTVNKTTKENVFRPNARVKMAEALAILVRFNGLPEENFIDVTPYKDVPAKHWASKYIVAAKSAGMLSYIAGDKLDPERPITRAEAVEMLSKTTTAAGLIKDLYDWRKGFPRQ